MPRFIYRPPPTIIRTIRKNAEDSHHHGTWKVAYADLMTAMMAFFLLLWIYAALNPKQKTDIAHYFAPTVGMVGESGMGIKGGQDTQEDNGKSMQLSSDEGIVKNQLRQGPLESTKDIPSIKEEGSSLLDEEDSRQRWQRQFMPIHNNIKQMLQNDPNSDLKNTVLLEKTRNGLKINLITDPRNPMFAPLTSTLTADGIKFLTSIANIIAQSRHAISITAHLASTALPYSADYSKWELSMERAKAVQRTLEAAKLATACIMRITGQADQELMFSETPDSERNNRIEVNILTNDCY